MEAFKLADTIRQEIERQAKQKDAELAVGKSETPDTVRLIGKLDLYELAKALVE